MPNLIKEKIINPKKGQREETFLSGRHACVSKFENKG
jgi:hypothetical protein